MQERIRLMNGHAVLASVINYEFDVDGTRQGIGNVIALDRGANGIDGTLPVFVVWTVYPSYRDENFWEAEHGDYGLLWDDAMKRMLQRFQENGFGRNQELHRQTVEPF